MEPKGKPTLADVDGTEPGRVQLLAVILKEDLTSKSDLMHMYYEEGDGERDPWLMAEGMQRSLEGDWPDHCWAIVGNWRARYLKWVRHQKEPGFLSEEAWSPQEYIACFK